MRTKNIAILLAVLAVLAVIFLLANFHLAATNTLSNDDTATARSGGDELPFTMQQRDRLTIVVSGDGPLAAALRNAVAKKFEYSGLGDAVVAEVGAGAAAEAGPYPAPVLFVHVEDANILWTPFYSAAKVAIKTQFISNGEAAAMTDGPMMLTNENGPMLTSDGAIAAESRSFGVMSRPGYHALLANELAQKLLDGTLKLYQPVP